MDDPESYQSIEQNKATDNYASKTKRYNRNNNNNKTKRAVNSPINSSPINSNILPLATDTFSSNPLSNQTNVASVSNSDDVPSDVVSVSNSDDVPSDVASVSNSDIQSELGSDTSSNTSSDTSSERDVQLNLPAPGESVELEEFNPSVSSAPAHAPAPAPAPLPSTGPVSGPVSVPVFGPEAQGTSFLDTIIDNNTVKNIQNIYEGQYDLLINEVLTILPKYEVFINKDSNIGDEQYNMLSLMVEDTVYKNLENYVLFDEFLSVDDLKNIFNPTDGIPPNLYNFETQNYNNYHGLLQQYDIPGYPNLNTNSEIPGIIINDLEYSVSIRRLLCLITLYSRDFIEKSYVLYPNNLYDRMLGYYPDLLCKRTLNILSRYNSDDVRSQQGLISHIFTNSFLNYFDVVTDTGVNESKRKKKQDIINKICDGSIMVDIYKQNYESIDKIKGKNLDYNLIKERTKRFLISNEEKIYQFSSNLNKIETVYELPLSYIFNNLSEEEKKRQGDVNNDKICSEIASVNNELNLDLATVSKIKPYFFKQNAPIAELREYLKTIGPKVVAERDKRIRGRSPSRSVGKRAKGGSNKNKTNKHFRAKKLTKRMKHMKNSKTIKKYKTNKYTVKNI
jgi:hypothetical protein